MSNSDKAQRNDSPAENFQKVIPLKSFEPDSHTPRMVFTFHGPFDSSNLTLTSLLDVLYYVVNNGDIAKMFVSKWLL